MEQQHVIALKKTKNKRKKKAEQLLQQDGLKKNSIGVDVSAGKSVNKVPAMQHLKNELLTFERKVFKWRHYQKAICNLQEKGFVEKYNLVLPRGSHRVLHGPDMQSFTVVRPHGGKKELRLHDIVYSRY